MNVICFIQETKDSDLTMRQQQLLCRRALRKLRWWCCQEIFAQAGTEDASLSLRPGMQEILRNAIARDFDVLLVVDQAHLRCSQAEMDALLATLLENGIHTFGARDGHWIEPGGRHWMVLPRYDDFCDWEEENHCSVK